MQLILFAVLMFLWGCGGNKEEKFIAPYNPECELHAIENEFIIVDKKGRFRKTRRLPVSSELNSAKWYEPNYRVSIEDRIDRRLTIRDGRPLVTVLSNEQIWQQLGIEEIWKQGFLGTNVSVAVIDTGVDLDSPYLENRWFYNREELESGLMGAGVDDDNNGFVDDVKGWNFVSSEPDNYDEWNHGTQMAHIIAGSENTPIGSGIAPESLILPVDFMGDDGGDEVAAVSALEYAVGRGVQIINNSWVTPCSRLLRTTLESYSEKNVLIVNSAGNQGRLLTDDLSFSSNILGANLINVGSLDPMGYRSSFSNYGTHINFYAPGEGLLTFSGRSISEGSGTSFSAAIVSGAAALLWSKYPHYTAEQIKRELLTLAYKPEGERDFYRLQLH